MSWSRRFLGYSVGDASDPATLLFPRTSAEVSAKRAIIYCHSFSGATGGSADFEPIDVATNPKLAVLMSTLSNAGYPILSPNFESNSWGNDIALTRIGEAITYAQGTLGCKSGAVFLVGRSMGGGAMMAYARAHPANVQAMVGMLPLSNLTDVWTNNRASATASINTAYSTYSEATYGATHNPVDFASQLTMPYQAWSASDDTTVVPSTVAAVASTYGGSIETHNALTGGHTDAAIGQITASSVLSFLAAHA